MNQEREAVARLQRFCDAEALAEVYGEYVSPLGAMRADIRDILALRSGGEEWRLVPVEPTEAMIEAYCEAHQRLGFHAWANASFVWPRVLAAAPSPSTHGG